MGFIAKLNRLIGLYVAAIKLSGKGKIWMPFLIYALLQLLLLLLCVSYVNPVINPILSPMVAWLGSGADQLYSHYPGLYVMLPQVFQWSKLFLGIIFEGLVTGITALLFLQYFGGMKRSEIKVSSAFGKWGQLLIVWFFITALLVVLNRFVPELLRGFVSGSPRRLAALEVFMRLFTVFVYSFFVYAIPALVVEKLNIGGAIRASVRYFAQYPIFTFFLALLPYLLTVPVTYITGNSDVIVAKFSPELVYYVLLAGILIDLVMNFLLTGAVVKFLIEEREA